MITEHVIGWIGTLFTHYGVWGISLAVFAEEFFIPIPATVTMLSSGFFLFAGDPINASSLLSLFIYAALPLATGLTLGSVINYWIFYFAGKPAIDRFGKFIRLSWADIERVQKFFNKGVYDEVLFFIGRTLPIIPSAVMSAASGVTRWPFKKYLLLTFFAEIVHAYVFAFIGWQAGKLYIHYIAKIERYEQIAFLFIIIAGIGYFIWKKRNGQEVGLVNEK